MESCGDCGRTGFLFFFELWDDGDRPRFVCRRCSRVRIADYRARGLPAPNVRMHCKR